MLISLSTKRGEFIERDLSSNLSINLRPEVEAQSFELKQCCKTMGGLSSLERE